MSSSSGAVPVRLAAPDGTTIAVNVVGSGDPIVLVHGTTANKEAWILVEPMLARAHTVWSYDRRGRGASDDTAEYSLEREVDDLLAVIDAAAGEGPVHLVGHSFGACCALEAAARRQELLTSLVVYEPPFHAERAAEAEARAIEALRGGEAERALLIFYREIAAISDDEISLLQSVPAVWEACIAAAGTLEREAAALRELGWQPDRYRHITTPTLLLSGQLTASTVFAHSDDILDAIPGAASQILEDQRHLATATGPETFATAVLDFIDAQQPTTPPNAP